VALGVPGGSGSWIFSTFGTTKVIRSLSEKATLNKLQITINSQLTFVFVIIIHYNMFLPTWSPAVTAKYTIYLKG
jgi:hypothetical protein